MIEKSHNYKIIIICLTLIPLILVACNACEQAEVTSDATETTIPTTSVSSVNTELHSSLDEINADDSDTYNYYYARKSREYQEAMCCNPIDIDYINDINQCYTTTEYSRIMNRYIDIWKSELKYANDTLVKISDPILESDLIESFDLWEYNLTEQMEIEHSLLMDMGRSGMHSLWLSKYLDAYRTRTFEVKYLAFQQEFDDNPLAKQFDSLMFCY